MKHHNHLALWAGLGFAAFAGVTASGCGNDSPTSMVDGNNGGTTGTGATGTGATINLGNAGNGIDLNPNAGSGPGDGMAGAGGGCGATAITANPPIINVLLVVDKSASMDEKPTGFAISKWAALDQALKSTFDATQAKISYGLDLYPVAGTDPKADYTCNLPAATAPVVVPVQDGTKSGPLILAAVENKANAPSGGTPTAAALARADYYFTKGAGKALKGEKYVLLATDGGPNCDTSLMCDAKTCTNNIDHNVANPNLCDPKVDPDGPRSCLDEAGSVAAVKKLATDGVKTIVVGIPGTEAYVSTLNALAAESGVTNPDAPPDYFAVDAKSGVAGLGKALEKITTGLVKSCELHLEEAPPDIEHLFVVIDGVELPKSDTQGWSIQDKTVSPPVVVINGDACTKLETEGAGYINITYGCPVYKPPVK